MVHGISLIFGTSLMAFSLPHLLSAQSTRVKDKELLRGKVFRVSEYELDPFMTRISNGNNITHYGMHVALAELMSDYFGMSLEYIPIPANESAKFGSGVASARQISRNEIDYANFPLPLSIHFVPLMDLSFPWAMEEFYMLQPYPESESRLVAPIRPFTSTVWIVFLLSTLVFVGVMSLIMTCDYRRTAGRSTDHQQQDEIILPFFLNSIYRGTEYVLTIITSQGNSVPYGSPLSMKILTGPWILAMVVMINAYAGLLTAYLSVPKLVPTVETFEDLANRPDLSVTIYRNNDLAFKMLQATSGPLKVLGDQLRNNPRLFGANNYELFTNVMRNKCVYPTPLSNANFYMRKDVKNNSGICRTTSSAKPLLYITAYACGFQKNSYITELANQRFMPRMWQMGYIVYLTRTYFGSTDQCRVDTTPKGKNSSLKLEDYVGAFVLVGLGYAIATIAFLVERISARKSSKANIKKDIRP